MELDLGCGESGGPVIWREELSRGSREPGKYNSPEPEEELGLGCQAWIENWAKTGYLSL